MADFDRRGGIYTAEGGGGRPAPEPQGVPRKVRAVPKPFPDGLFSHLEGDALNVAHLVPLARRLSRSGLVDALTAHYGSPGRLADFRRQLERSTRTIGEDPAIFATALETLAVKAFGDMGQTA